MIDDLLTVDPELLDDDNADLFADVTKKKHKILMLSDHPLSPSGVGVQARFLIEGLIATGKYTFRCLGGAQKHPSYEVVAPHPDFIIKPVDGFGDPNTIRDILAREKPDAVFIFTDPRQFIWLWSIEDEVRQVCPIVYWHVWDNDPYPDFNKAFYEGTDLINCISKKTYELVQPRFPEKTHYVPHAFPKEVYSPLPESAIDQLRGNNFGDRKDWFVALWVNRNATRKMPGDVMEAFGLFLENLEKKHGHKNAMLIMHTNPSDEAGPNLLAQSQALGLQDRVLFSTQSVDFSHVNILHNIADVTVNISKNEGFGLSTLVSLQCGKPIIALATGGEREKVYDSDGVPNGVALEPVTRALVGSQLVPYIYEDFTTREHVADALMTIYEMTPEEKKHLKDRVIKFVDENYNHQKVVQKWDETLSSTIEQFKTSPVKKWDLLEIDTPVRRVADRLPQEAASVSVPSPRSQIKIKKHRKAGR